MCIMLTLNVHYDNLLVIGKLNLFNENGNCHVSTPAVTGNCNFSGW